MSLLECWAPENEENSCSGEEFLLAQLVMLADKMALKLEFGLDCEGHLSGSASLD